LAPVAAPNVSVGKAPKIPKRFETDATVRDLTIAVNRASEKSRKNGHFAAFAAPRRGVRGF